MRPVSISVVIPTFHRYSRLAQTLSCVAASEGPPFEVIVVDQTRPPAFDPAAWPTLTLKALFPKKANLPAARNAGIAAAAGGIILFVDDDVTFGPGFVRAHAEAHAARPAAGAVTGRIGLLPPDFWPPQDFVSAVDPETAEFKANFGLDRAGTVDYPCGCNMSYKRAALEKTGPFDEHYTGNALYEEIDYARRLRAAGFDIYFEPRAHMIHHRDPGGGTRRGGRANYYFTKFKNTGYFYFKHLDAGKPAPFLKAMKNEIEFYSRGEKGRNFLNAGIFFLGLFLGVLRGLLNRTKAPIPS